MHDKLDDQGTPEQDGTKKVTDGIIFDIARKAVSSSVKSLLVSEESIRSLIGAIVPKEIGSYIKQEVSLLRTEFLNAMMAEMTKFLQQRDVSADIRSALDGLDFDIHVNVSVHQHDKTPNASASPSKAPGPGHTSKRR